MNAMHTFIHLLVIILCISSLSCVNVQDREGRINPFDTKGDNWFPPRVQIVKKDTISVAQHDSFAVKILVGDDNGRTVAVVWSLDGKFLQTDSLGISLDSIVEKDTLIDTNVTPVPRRLYDSMVVDSTPKKPSQNNADSITITYLKNVLDSTYDTLSYIDSSVNDTTWKWIPLDTALFGIVRYIWRDTIINDTAITTHINSKETNYQYTSTFALDTIGAHTLNVKAVDDDGIESLTSDSVIVSVEAALKRSLFFTNNNRER